MGEALRIAESAAKRRFQRAQAALRRAILARLDALPGESWQAATQRLLIARGACRPGGNESRSPGEPA